MELYSVEGNSQKLDGGAMFGNAPKAMWAKWIQADEHNRVFLACRCLLVKNTDGKYYLFETGVGAFFEPKLKERYGICESEHVLLDQLKKYGVSHEQIAGVILSHLHFDHAGGLLSAHDDGEPRLLFPNAQYYVGAEHWLRAKSPHFRDRASFIPLLHELLEKSGRLVLISQEQTSHELSSFVTFHFSNGHTPGLLHAEVKTDDGPLFFASDIIPGFPWMHLPITTGYDRNPELLIEEKRGILERLLSHNGRVFFTHDEKHSTGLVKKDQNGKFYAQACPL